MKKLCGLVCAVLLSALVLFACMPEVRASAETAEMSGLGYSIDAAKTEYFETEEIRVGSPVFETEWLQDRLGSAMKLTVNTSETYSVSSGSYSDIAGKIESGFGLSAETTLGKSLFTLNAENGFDVNGTFDYSEYISQFYYMLNNEIVRYTYSLPDYSSDLSVYRQNLHPNYRAAVSALFAGEMTYRDFFATYGTHVLMSAKYGGRLEVYYTAVSNYVDVGGSMRTEIHTDLQASIVDNLNVGGGLNFDLEIANDKETNQYLSYFHAKARGGDAFAAASFNGEISNDFRNWALSVSDEPALIGAVSDGLVPLWELLPPEYNTETNIEKMKNWFRSYCPSQPSDVFEHEPSEFLISDVDHFRPDKFTITDSGRWEQMYDEIKLTDILPYDPKLLYDLGYTYMQINISFDAKKIDNGTCYVFLYNSVKNESDDYLIASQQFTLQGSGEERKFFSFDVNTESFTDGMLYILYGASGNWEDKWENWDLRIYIRYGKRALA